MYVVEKDERQEIIHWDCPLIHFLLIERSVHVTIRVTVPIMKSEYVYFCTLSTTTRWKQYHYRVCSMKSLWLRFLVDHGLTMKHRENVSCQYPDNRADMRPVVALRTSTFSTKQHNREVTALLDSSVIIQVIG
jgi:hypothetical protein